MDVEGRHKSWHDTADGPLSIDPRSIRGRSALDRSCFVDSDSVGFGRIRRVRSSQAIESTENSLETPRFADVAKGGMDEPGLCDDPSNRT